MANSMDVIKVQYGISFTPKEQDLIDYPLDEKQRKMAEELKNKIKTATLCEFLEIDLSKLSEKEQKIQHAIKLIYELNKRKPHIYSQFPTFRSKENPLTIDITRTENSEISYAFFDEMKNRISFTDINDTDFLVQVLAHELKHAEQTDEEVYHYHLLSLKGFSMENAYAWHQLEFLKEAQAYTTDSRVYYEIFGVTNKSEVLVKVYKDISEKYTNIFGHKNYKKIETKMITFLLGFLYDGITFPYKNKYDMHAPIGENDTGLDHIPNVFHLPQSLMLKIQETPRKAVSLLGRLLQAQKNKHIDEYIQLLHEGVDKNERIPKSYFEYVLKNGSPGQIDDILQLKKQAFSS